MKPPLQYLLIDHQSPITKYNRYEMTNINSDLFEEHYIYKVVYPGGTFIRSSPSVNAERIDSLEVV